MKYRNTYILLISLSSLFIFLPNNQLSILSIIRFEADPLLIAVFNSLGLLPALFFIERLSKSKSWTKSEILSYALSFGLGAFALLWGLDNKANKIQSKLYKILLIGIMIGLFGTILYGFIYGNIESYIFIWQNDLFIRIMTLDFIVLLSLWIKRFSMLFFKSNR